MRTEISNAIFATDRDAQYDESAKRLLGQKSILAHILTKTVDEFAGMAPKDVVSHIEGEPFINKVLVEPGITNAVTSKDGTRVVGFNSESQEFHEGMIRFDIIFYELHRLLGALLSQNLTVKERLDIIGNEYAIPIEKDFREDVSVMCNLSQKIKETGIEIGKREMILSMHRKGYTTAQIADVAGITEKQVEDIIKLELQLV